MGEKGRYVGQGERPKCEADIHGGVPSKQYCATTRRCSYGLFGSFAVRLRMTLLQTPNRQALVTPNC